MLTAGIERARQLVSDNRAAMLRVYELMVGRIPHIDGRHFGFEEPLVFTYDEVRAAVLGVSKSSSGSTESTRDEPTLDPTS